MAYCISLKSFGLLYLSLTLAQGFDDNEIVKQGEHLNKPPPKVSPDVLEAYYYATYADIELDTTSEAGRLGNSTEASSCHEVRGVPEALRMTMLPEGLHYKYTKYTEAYNIPVLASAEVSDQAVTRACYVLRFLLADRADLRELYYKAYGRVAIIPKEKDLHDIPEYRFLPDVYSSQTRGLGAITVAPVSTAGEENLLCLDDDPNINEDILIRQVAQGIVHLALMKLDPGLEERLEEQWEMAMGSNWWQGTYAAHTKEAYLGEGIQSYFSANAYAEPPNGNANHINTRTKLRTYDSRLYNMVHDIFPCANNYIKRCNSRENEYLQTLRMNCPQYDWISTLRKRLLNKEEKKSHKRSRTRSRKLRRQNRKNRKN